MYKSNTDHLKQFLFILGSILLLCYFIFLIFFNQHFSQDRLETKTADDFGIKTIFSSVDFDNDNLDDYSDFVIGARIDAENMPTYDGHFYAKGGYPPDNIGVCSDTVWRAFKQAGYSLKDMVDEDIESDLKSYTNITVKDKNIDFRRVKNFKVYFSKYAEVLTTDPSKIEEWQPGDIVIFNCPKNTKHIGIVSDKRNNKGIPLLIHNNGIKTSRENDYIEGKSIDCHFRFDASKIESSKLIAWQD